MKYKSTQAIKMLLSKLPSRRRWQLALLALLMLLGGFAEVVTLGLVVPFLAFLIDPLQALQLRFVAEIASIFDLSDPNNLRWQFTVLFAVAAVGSAAVRLTIIWATTKIVFSIGHEIGVEVYQRVIHQPYAVHVSKNSSEIIGAIEKVNPIFHILIGLLNAISAILISIFILVTLVIINPEFTAFTIIALGGIYAAIMQLMKKRLEKNSESISQTMNERIKITQEGLGSIRDILLDHGQQSFSNRFKEKDWKLRRAQASNYIIGPSPRFIVEALGIMLIAGFAYMLVISTSGLTTVVPELGAMALGAQRLLPNLQLIYIGITNLRGQEQSVFDVIELLDQPIDEQNLSDLEPLMFKNQIQFENVGFQFQGDSPMVLKELSFSIAKGQRIGFLGPTGSGKSTALDLLMGLLTPSTGEISVDGTPLIGKARLQWQKNITHVPQDLYLMDASFAENIAFCETTDDIDLQRVKEAAKLAHIHDFISDKPRGYHSLLGERGVQISGGQRQRIGIARALYRRASVIVLDEATSALDTEMEAAVMSSIEKIDYNLTIIIIAHRISTLKNCDHVYRLVQGRISEKMEAVPIQ